MLSSCSKDDDRYTIGTTEGVKAKDLITFGTIDHLSVEADGIQKSTIKLIIAPGADPDFRSVVLKTSLGKFSNGNDTMTLPTDADGNADFTLQSTEVGVAKITAIVKDIMIDTSITFTSAQPDDILISADVYTGDATTTFTATINLFRNPGRGIVSDPIKVSYSLTPDLSSALPLIFPDFSFSENKSTSVTISNPFGVTGDFVFTAKVMSASGVELPKSVKIQIK